MSGVEELVRRLLGTDDPRPLRNRDGKIGREGLTCPLDGGTKLCIDYALHRDGASWIPMAWCSSGHHSGIDAIARAVGMTPAEVRAGNEPLRHKYRQQSKPVFTVTDTDVSEWTDNLWRDKGLRRYLRQTRLILPEVVRTARVGHDGERYTLPVYDDGSLIGVRRYLPDPPEDVEKIRSAPGSRAGLFPDVPDGPKVVLCEGEWDCLAARSIGLPAVTGTGGAGCWKEEWTPALTGKAVWIVYDRDKAGLDGSNKVAQALKPSRVYVVTLPLPYTEHKGPDLTDFLRQGGDLRKLLNSTKQTS